MTSTPPDGDGPDVPGPLDRVCEALSLASSALKELQELIEELLPPERKQFDFEDVEGVLDDLLERVEDVIADFEEDEEENDRPMRELLRDLKRDEAEGLAEALRNAEFPDEEVTLDDLPGPLSEAQRSKLDKVSSAARKAAWHAYNVMIDAV